MIEAQKKQYGIALKTESYFLQSQAERGFFLGYIHMQNRSTHIFSAYSLRSFENGKFVCWRCTHSISMHLISGDMQCLPCPKFGSIRRDLSLSHVLIFSFPSLKQRHPMSVRGLWLYKVQFRYKTTTESDTSDPLLCADWLCISTRIR